MGTLRITLLLLVVGGILLAEGKSHHKTTHDPNESYSDYQDLDESHSEESHHNSNEEHHTKKHHDTDEDHHDSDESHHHDSDDSHHDSDESHHDSDESHHDSDESHHDSDENHHGHRSHHDHHRRHKRHHDSDESHHDTDEDHHDSDESHHDSDESHHDSDESHHDSDESHHDSDENHHGHHRRHKRHHDSDESHHDSDESHHDSDESHHDSDESHHDSDESHHGHHGHHGHHRRHHDHHRRHKHHHDSDESHHDDDDHNTYNFHIGEGFGPYEYIDSADGFLKGFDLDILRAVCQEAHKTCYYTLDTDENCWRTSGQHELPGQGLLDDWYDGCIGLAPTPERLNSFNFTLPHAPNVKASVHFRSGEVPADKDLTGKKVGFVSGWAFSRNCLARQNAWKGNSVPEYTAVMYEDHDDLVNGLLKKEVDAILTTEASDLSKQNIVASDNWFYCATAGPSVMVQYGADVTDWWNHALERLISNGSYRRLCQKAKDTHGSHGNIQCLEQ